MPTRQQLESALKNADSAGDIQAAKSLANALKGGQYDDQPMQQQGVTQKEPGMFDIFTGESKMTPQMELLKEIGAAPELNELSVPAFKTSLGLMTTGDTESLKGVFSQQFGDKVSFTEDEKGNSIVNLPSGQYALNIPGFSGQDFMRGAMDFASFTPAGRAASIPGAIAKNALTEAALEGTEAAVGGEFSPEDVAIAGGLGGGLKGVENVVGAGYRALKGNKANTVVDSSTDSGIPVLTSDIRQPQTFAGKMAQQTGEKIPLFGTGAKREVQQKAREAAVDETINKYGEFSYKSIVNSLKTQKDRVKSAAGSVLEKTGNKLDTIGEIPLTTTRNAIGLTKAELTKKGVIQSGGAIDDLQTLINSIDEAPQTFTTLKENRTAFREIVKGADKAERTQLTSRAKALLARVETAMKKDMSDFARKNLTPQEFNQWQKANSVYAQEAIKLTKTRIKNVLDKGDVTPEAVQTILFSKNPSEVKNIYSSLTSEGRTNARSAIISKVANNLSRRASGITPDSFASEMKKYGLQVDVLFKGEEKRQLRGLIKALDATRRAQAASVTTPTGQQVLGAGTGLALFIEPVSTISTGLSLGTVARLYESPAVRNALLRLDSIQPRSTQFEKALLEFETIVNAAAQTLRDEQSDK